MAYPNIALDAPVLVQPEITSSEVVVVEVRERPLDKTVVVQVTIDGRLKVLTAWSGTEYDAIGQWTDADMEARIKELMNQ